MLQVRCQNFSMIMEQSSGHVNYLAAHCEYHASGCSDNMYESIDMALSKIEKQASKQKDKFNKLHRGKLRVMAS
jgi:ribosomal subunit interface protein